MTEGTAIPSRALAAVVKAATSAVYRAKVYMVCVFSSQSEVNRRLGNEIRMFTNSKKANDCGRMEEEKKKRFCGTGRKYRGREAKDMVELLCRRSRDVSCRGVVAARARFLLTGFGWRRRRAASPVRNEASGQPKIKCRGDVQFYRAL